MIKAVANNTNCLQYMENKINQLFASISQKQKKKQKNKKQTTVKITYLDDAVLHH